MAAETDASTIGPAATRRPASLSPAMETDAEKLRFIEEMTANVDAVQERVLAEILGRNAESEYLRNCGLAGAIDRATFRAKVPVVLYEDLQLYIRRIAEGDRSPILSGSKHPISEFLTSSGTSGGERKLLPTVEDEIDRRKLLSSLAMSVINRYIPGLDEGSALCFFFVKSETMTPGGLPARPTLTSYYKSDHFKNRTDGRYKTCTSPLGAILCEDAFQSMYAQMLYGLCHRNDVVRLCAVFASALVRAIYFLQQNWEPLATDIETGVLNHRVTDPSARKEVGDILRADLELARCIRTECSKEDWAECYFGLNLRPFCDPSEVSYTIMPNMAYFEFIPMDGDILRVTGFHNMAPQQSRVGMPPSGPLEIRVVKAGTFEKLMDYAISHGTSIAQYKVPRCGTLPPVIELLDSHVISCHFSPKLPHWASAGQQLDSTKEE
ncbi:hypothetical protein QOZ80_9BG0697490 [Eleusine coracana subsp. coracana]|nr:hypothetical protein QOZ80_9BG0697490 [Eleusine coracana subsp. coracana]